MKKKKIIISLISIFIFISLITALLIIKPEKNKKTESEIKEEIQNEIHPDNDKEENIEKPENPIIEDSPVIDNSKEENENSNDEQIDSKPNENVESNNSNENNEQSNSQQSNNEHSNNSNNTQDSTTNNNTTKPEETPEQELPIGPTIVNTSTINLNNYDTDLKINKSGNYTLTGKLNHSLYIEASGTVTLNLNGVTIKSTEDAAIANINNNNLIINLSSGTTNILSDNGTETDYDASLYSNGHLTIDGTGILRVVGNRVDDEGIATKNAPITINNGAITIVTKDDGINTGGDGGTITINGGVTYIDAGGDGIDSNKDIIVNGGTLYTTGSSTGNYSGLDADSGLTINGGTVIATGSSYLQIPLSSSKQRSLSLGFSSYNDDETIYALVDANGNEIISFMAKEKFQGITISSDKLTNGTYYLYSGGTHSGTLTNYIYTNGTYTAGELLSINSNSSFNIETNSSSYTDPSTNIMGINDARKITKKIYKQNINMNVFIPSLIISTIALSLIAYKLNKKIVK